MLRLHRNKLIDKDVLLRIYKDFKKYPLRIFVASDFFKSTRVILREKYLHTLVSLDLIEEVPTVYEFGLRGKKARRGVRGYKIIQKQNDRTKR